MPGRNSSVSKYLRRAPRKKKVYVPVSMDDLFNEDLSDILPLPHERESQMKNPTDTTIEWECAASAFKQLAFNYGVLLGKTPQDCERDLLKALELVIKRQPSLMFTEFYKEAKKK